MISFARLRKIAGRLAAVGAVLAVSCLVALLLAEFLIRIAAPQQLIQIRPDLWQPMDSIGWARRPNIAVQINTGERTVDVITDREGYRVGQVGRREAPTKILLLGDSFIEALQVEHEQTVAHLVETAVSERLGKPVAVRNAGVAGWNPNHYRLRAKQLLSRDTFALVIVALYVANDAVTYRWDTIPPRAPTARRSFRLPRSASWKELVQAMLAPVNDGLETRSHLYILAKNQLSTLRMRLGMTADYLPPEYLRTEASSPRWRNVADLSRDLARDAWARRVPVLFVLIPERIQVYPEDFQRYLLGFGVDSSTVDVDQPSRLLLRELTADSLRVVDALPAMRAAATSRPRLYGTVDQHLSAEGHRALSEVMVPAILPLLQTR